MYEPKFKYSHDLVRKLCEVQFFAATVNERSVPDEWDQKARTRALHEAVAHTLNMENVKVSPQGIGQVLDSNHGDDSSDSAQQVKNFYEALLFVGELVVYGEGHLNTGDIKDLNRHCLQKLKKAEWYCGQFREIQNWVVDPGKEEIVFTPPSPEEVPELVDDLILWMKDDSSKAIHPVVKAGIAHHRMMFINPFVAGNERAACLVSRYILMHDNYFVRNWGWLTDYYSQNMTIYYRKLFSGLDQSGTREKDLTEWLEFFTDGIRESFARTQTESQSAQVKPAFVQGTSEFPAYLEGEYDGDETDDAAKAAKIDKLNERQRQILELGRKYSVFHRRDIRSELELAGRYHPKTISRDLKALVDLGYLKKMGERKGVRYSLIKRI